MGFNLAFRGLIKGAFVGKKDARYNKKKIILYMFGRNIIVHDQEVISVNAAYSISHPRDAW